MNSTRAITIPTGRFNFNSQTEADCRFMFRFGKTDIPELARLLGFPDPFITKARYHATAIEVVCIMLIRLAWPHRLGSMVQTFGRSREALSALSNAAMLHVYERFGHLLDWDYQRLDSQWMQRCGDAIYMQGAPLKTCIGFIDGTRKHALKYQAVMSPDGIIVHLHGPEPGSRHDAYLLARSQLVSKLQDKLPVENTRYVIYGDPAYGINDVIASGIKGARLDVREAEFNRRMSAVRVSVEWGFGIVRNLWTFVDYRGGQKLWFHAVGVHYSVAVILTNVHTCMKEGNQVSSYFGMKPPTAEEYLRPQA
ncbi:hypothetical protein H257_15223 [Aphanomyces astaci]|uniref:DDE Tnp4 domain-containing protein n=1 Tax=Aphanomyces astaci TaxID=112090 RepID=W4FPI9_APHAT|nr:hypothetical protein H257_15223 [Aphanomyces astaci]ETV68871.1 hypothetical protein H257_15223 [Aphanomyces astaci]|eukprot:XP_009841548.1 hypothetical protein H257_15223 [Aphanomyces astaci]